MDALGDRMKAYENISRISLTRRMPVVVRIDGKAFHTFTKGFKKPFDSILIGAMQDTCIHLCENIMNCQLAYTQSDEISLLLTDYKTRETQPWFGNNLQKIVSIAASMATMAFNKAYEKHVLGDPIWDHVDSESARSDLMAFRTYVDKLGKAMFDARAFILPKEEVCNYFIWRQQDATRNSIQMVARSMFSHREAHGRSCDTLQAMMHEKGVNWNDLPTVQKRGSCIVKESYEKEGVMRSRWKVDTEIPIFTHNRDYIDKYVFLKEDVA